jgi:hypothetical protein
MKLNIAGMLLKHLNKTCLRVTPTTIKPIWTCLEKKSDVRIWFRGNSCGIKSSSLNKPQLNKIISKSIRNNRLNNGDSGRN